MQTLPLSAALEGVRNRFDDSAHLARPLVSLFGRATQQLRQLDDIGCDPAEQSFAPLIADPR